jgi:hypothetical protein
LRNIYKNPATGHKMTVMSPPLALGQAVHEVIESLAVLPAEERFKISLLKKLDPAWLKITGKKGGFKSFEIETEYRDRARQMLINLQENPGPVARPAIKIKTGTLNLPNYYLSDEDNIILCGKIDWLEYVPENDSVKIIDFKTGKNEESEESLQLPIYLLLASNTQSKKVIGAAYWYLDRLSHEASERQAAFVEKALPSIEDSYKKVLDIAKQIKNAREKQEFVCPKGGCNACRPYERILKGEGELVATSETRQDVYVLPD